MYPNGLTDLTEISNQDFWGDAPFELKFPFWEIEMGLYTFKTYIFHKWDNIMIYLKIYKKYISWEDIWIFLQLPEHY